jgi:hypothetical protein
LLAASTLLVFALQEAGRAEYSWSSGAIIANLTISGVSWVGFFAWILYLERGGKRKAIISAKYLFSRPTGPAILLVNHAEGSLKLTVHQCCPFRRLPFLYRSGEPAAKIPNCKRLVSNHGWYTSLAISSCSLSWYASSPTPWTGLLTRNQALS